MLARQALIPTEQSPQFQEPVLFFFLKQPSIERLILSASGEDGLEWPGVD